MTEELDQLKADYEQALQVAADAQSASEAAGEHALEAAQYAQTAREAYESAEAATLPEQTPAPEVPEPGADVAAEEPAAEEVS